MDEINKYKLRENYKRFYYKRKNSNLCVQCCKVKDTTKSKCSECLEKDRVEDSHKVMNHICSHCGGSTVGSNNVRICSSCNKKRTRYTRERMRSTKEKYVKLMGGKCFKCGIQTDRYEIYDFHHINPLEKDEHIADLFRYSEEKMRSKIEEELKKCILVCSNCHRTIHYYLMDQD